MRSRKAPPYLMLVLFITPLSLACGLGGIGSDPPPPTDPPQPPADPPTESAPPTEAPLPTTEVPEETAVCDPDRVIAQLREEGPPEQLALVYSGGFVVGEGTPLRLSFWVVDFLLDPEVGDNQDAILNNAGNALNSALQWTKQFENADPCVQELFQNINPIVVDLSFNGWISLDIPTGALPESIDLSDPQLTAILDQDVLLNYLRQTPPAPFDSPSADACDWLLAREGLQAAFLPQSNGNTTFFFVRDDNGNNVWAYLDNSNVTLAPEDYLSDQVEQILAEIECLHPVPDNLILQTLSETGTVLFSGRLPRAGIEAGDPDQFVPFP